MLKKIKDKGLVPFELNQLTVNLYECGSGISQHIDNHACFEDGIVIISMSSSIGMYN